MSCTYELKDGDKTVVKDSILELSQHYYRAGVKLANQKIFSTEEIVDSVRKPLLEIASRKDSIRSNAATTGVVTFISQVNTSIFKSKGINKDRLVPEYNEDNRILNFILDKMPATLRNSVTKLENLQDIVNKDSTLTDTYTERLKEIKDIIESEKLTNQLGIDIHNGLDLLLRSQSGTKGEDISQIVDRIVDKNADILDNPDQWKIRLKDVLGKVFSEISTIIKDGGTILSELDIDTMEDLEGTHAKDAAVKLKGRIDLVAIDREGNVHIYDVKVSKNPYDEWDQVKSYSTDWQLAFYRGLLGQYIDVKGATLNVIPISTGSVVTDENGRKQVLHNNLKYDKQVNLLQNPNKGLRENGALWNVVAALIPQKTIIDYDPERQKEFEQELKQLLPNYEIKTSNLEYNPQKIVEAARRSGTFDLFNSFDDTLTGELVTQLSSLGFTQDSNSRIFKYKWEPGTSSAEKEAKFAEAVQVYTDFAKANKNNNLVSLKNSVISAVNSGALTVSWHNNKIEDTLNSLLKQFLLGNHRVITRIPELDKLGFILFQNKENNKYSLLSVSAFTANASYENNLLYGELEYLKAYAFLNKFHKELDLKRNKVEAVSVFNLQEGVPFYRPLDAMFEKFKNRMEGMGMQMNIQAHEVLPKDEEVARDIFRNSLRTYSKEDKDAVLETLAPILNQFTDVSGEQLIDIQRKLREKWHLEERTLDKLSYDNEREYLYALISSMIVLKSALVPYGDFMDMKNFGIAFSDFKSIVNSLWTDKVEAYDRTGKAIQGIIGGLKTITPDKVNSIDLRNINMLLNSANSFVRQDFYKQSTIIGSLTREYFKKIHYSPTEQNWIGNYRGKYENMWVRENGSISNIWSVKNPYAFDASNGLTAPEREHLRKMLFEIKKYELGITEKENVNIDTLETLSKSKSGLKILAAIENGNYFKMPLVKNQQITRAGTLWKDGFKGFADAAKEVGQEVQDFFDSRELREEERINLKKTQLGYYEMYDIYGLQSDSFKKDMVDKHGDIEFELSLDIIAHKSAFNKIRQDHMNRVLPIVNSYMWWMKLRAGVSNKDISKELDYVVNRINLAAYDAPIVNEEAEDVIKAVSVAKRITTMGMLAFRPVLLFKELTIGLYKGIALASTKIYGKQQFSLKSYTKAVKSLITVDNKFGPEWNLLDAVNNFYGFANRDVNAAATRLQTNRRGLLMGLSPWMYSCNTTPDYYNRLSLFLAKMYEDGSFDAHSINSDGMLQYDEAKDARFSKYLKERENHKNAEGKYIPAKSDTEYNKQRNLYNLVMNEINDERQLLGRERLIEGKDALTHAYSEKERLGYKSFTDTVYGYFDKDSQAEWHNTWYGIVFLQFLQFWPGKMSLWYGKKISSENSLMGDHVQKTQLVDGKEVPLWRKPVYDELNPDDIIDFTETTENTGDPALAWVGTPQEGLAQSMLKTMRYVLTGDMGKFKSDPLLQRRFTYGLADSALMMLVFGMVAAMIQGFLSDHGTDGLDGHTVEFMKQVNSRVLTEANLYQNTFGAINGTPAFLSYSMKVAGDMQDVMSGNKTISDFSKNFRAFEVFNLDEDKEYTGQKSSYRR